MPSDIRRKEGLSDSSGARRVTLGPIDDSISLRVTDHCDEDAAAPSGHIRTVPAVPAAIFRATPEETGHGPSALRARHGGRCEACAVHGNPQVVQLRQFVASPAFRHGSQDAPENQRALVSEVRDLDCAGCAPSGKVAVAPPRPAEGKAKRTVNSCKLTIPVITFNQHQYLRALTAEKSAMCSV